MALEQNKRRRPIPMTSQRSRKRQKTGLSAPSLAQGAKRHPIALDALPWNEVEMPHMFEDAEGFFGLQEVDDVEVIREGNRLQFVSTITQSVYDDDEFEGFADNPSTITDSTIGAPILEKSGMAIPEQKKKKADEKDKKRNDKQLRLRTDEAVDGNAPSPLQASNAFSVLEADLVQEEVDVSGWEELDLSSEVLSALAKLGFTQPTPIQSASIPEILAGHDVIGKASTGSGKTLAFGIPILEKWLETHRDKENLEKEQARLPTALILSPTRELAHQLTDHMKALCSGLSDAPYVTSVTGGLSVQKQHRQLANADIIVGTPGRLWEVMSTSNELSASLKKIKFLVVDEADRLLSEGHFPEVKELLDALDRQVDADMGHGDHVPDRQTLVYSATLYKGLQQKLAGRGKPSLVDNGESMEYLLKKLSFREETPKFVDVNPISQMADGLKEGLVECAGTDKDLYLYALILYHPNQRTLIFTNSIHSVRRLTPLLQNLNLPAHALHSQMAQKARMRSIERFSNPKYTGSILVATDVAARGLDIGGVELVVHYHLPRTADMYVHRSGRTARAQAAGSSILLCAPEEVVGTRRLVAKVHAQNGMSSGASESKHYIRSLDIDRKVVARLKPRVTLSKKLSDSALAKEKKGHDDDWIRKAAEELGVDYDSEEFEAAGGGQKGRGTGRKLKEKEARGLTKDDLGALRRELKALLGQRINVGVSETYLTSGTVDIDELLKGAKGDFLGRVDGIGLHDL